LPAGTADHKRKLKTEAGNVERSPLAVKSKTLSFFACRAQPTIGLAGARSTDSLFRFFVMMKSPAAAFVIAISAWTNADKREIPPKGGERPLCG